MSLASRSLLASSGLSSLSARTPTSINVHIKLDIAAAAIAWDGYLAYVYVYSFFFSLPR